MHAFHIHGKFTLIKQLRSIINTSIKTSKLRLREKKIFWKKNRNFGTT